MEVTELLQHCPWSPSYLKQILDCTMSLPKDGLAVDDSGEAAERGTLQHTYLIKDRLAKYFHKESVDMDTSVFTDDELDDILTDIVSDETGFLVESFEYDEVDE